MKKIASDMKIEKLNGKFYTPQFMVNNILDLCGYYGDNILKKHVMENSCGDGAFLTEIVDRYCKACVSMGMSVLSISEDLSMYIHGIEIDECECNKCIKNVSNIALQYGVENVAWDIICADTLSIQKYNKKMDFVIGNPPYVRVHNLGNTFNEIKRFSFAQNGMTDLFIVFYEIGLNMLNETGILGYITPSSFFNSIAGSYMRQYFIDNNYLDAIVDLKHYQAFDCTTYTTVVILKKDKNNNKMNYYQFDEKNQIPYFVENLSPNDYYISGNFYFSKKENLNLLKKIFFNKKHCCISVKNGYATLCDSVFINEFDFSSNYIIPVIKASKGIKKKIIYPYTTNGLLVSEKEISGDTLLYNYLLDNKEKLLKRSSEKNNELYWYAFGRSQAINDTFKDKIAINTLIRDENDLKIIKAPAGTGVYSGLYLVGDGLKFEKIEKMLNSKEFAVYVSLLSKYKSGGYYTFSSKDIKAYLDYKMFDMEECLYDDK